jgi:hypothetical protein
MWAEPEAWADIECELENLGLEEAENLGLGLGGLEEGLKGSKVFCVNWAGEGGGEPTMNRGAALLWPGLAFDENTGSFRAIAGAERGVYIGVVSVDS